LNDELKFTITNIIPPRPGAIVGTVVLDADDDPPVSSVTVTEGWLWKTHARIGGRISFIDDRFIRYWWEELPPDVQRAGVMDELFGSRKQWRADRDKAREGEADSSGVASSESAQAPSGVEDEGERSEGREVDGSGDREGDTLGRRRMAAGG